MSITPFDIANMYDILSTDSPYDWFTAKLLRLLRDADETNLNKLAEVYPAEFAYFAQYKYGGVPRKFSGNYMLLNWMSNQSTVMWIDEDGNQFSHINVKAGRDF